jgi:hypothetical protein
MESVYMKRFIAFFCSRNSCTLSRSVFVAGAIVATAVFKPADVSAQVTNITSGKVIKWDQPPVLAVPTNVFYGWNEKSVFGVQVAADDWVCTTTNPVRKIRWWGSFIGWNSSDPTPVLPFDFRIHFWTDQAAGPGNPFSHPQSNIWQIITTNFTVQCAGQDYDPRTGTFETCFIFEATLNPQEWFFQQPLNGTNIYWLSIAADYPTTGNPPYPFGWKTRPRDPTSRAPDSAVDIFNPASPFLGSIFVAGAPIFYAALSNQWDLAFELVTAGTTTIQGSKWEQVPDLTPTGMDVNATQPAQVPAFQPPFLLADDFLCTSPGLITNVTIWGSWLNDVLPQNPAGGPPDANNVTFILSFHDDISSNQSPTGYSMPGPIRRQFTFGPGAFTHSVRAANIQEGWLTPPGAYIPPPADTVCHQYDFPIGLNLDPFFQDGTAASPKVFWLDVQAIPMTGGFTNAIFGWKTCITNWNDAGVWANAIEGFPGPWNKLIYPPPHPKFGTNVDFAFRLNTASSVVTTQFVKWSQPPVVAANPGNWYNGWNEPSVDGGGFWNNILLTNIVADDWLCTNARPVSDIHWWGSFLGWASNSLPSDPLMGFHFAIWTDVPTGPNAPFSHPGVVLWENRALVGDPNLRMNWVGWDLDPRDPCLADIETCFQFDYSLPGTNNWFFQQPGTNIYWLSISAMYPAGIPLQYPFGWKTRPHVPVPPDDAVRIFNPLGPALPPGTPFGFGQPIEFPTGISWDMAFRLTSCQRAPLTNIVFTNIVATNIISPPGRVVIIKWNSQPGSVYQFQEILTLTNQPVNPWTDVGSPIVGPVNTAIFTNAPDVQHFYRIRLPDLCP